MKKQKFVWDITIEENFPLDNAPALIFYLNNGLNSAIAINHERFLENVAEKLNEILFHEHDMGNKTEINGISCVSKALEMAKNGNTVNVVNIPKEEK